MADFLRRIWRSPALEDDPVGSEASPATRKKRHNVGPIFTRFINKRTLSFNDVPKSVRPKLEKSNHSPPSKEHPDIHLSAALTRSLSAPTSMDTQDDRHNGSSEVTLGGNEAVTHHEIPPSIDNLMQDSATGRISASRDSPAVIDPPSIEQESVPQMDAHEEFGEELGEELGEEPDATDSGSVPTQIIDVSDDLSDEPANVTGSTLDDLRGMYGFNYRQAHDIAGLESPQGAGVAPEYLSPHDMSIQLNVMLGRVARRPSRFSQRSITPWLLAPSLYSEALQKMSSSVDRQSSLARPYVSTWVFVSLTMSRIDGLRFVFTIYLFLRIHGADGSTVSLSRAATFIQQEWYKDPSNVSGQSLGSQKTVPQDGYHTGLQMEISSTHSSKVSALMGGSDRSWSQDQVLDAVNISLDSTALVMPQTLDPRMLDQESIRDDETELPPSRTEAQSEPQQSMDTDTDSENEDTKLEETDSREPVSDSVTDYEEAGQAIEIPLSDQSDTLVNPVSNSFSTPGKSFEGKKAIQQSKQTGVLLLCEDADCVKTFAKKSELDIHMDIWHPDSPRLRNSNYQVAPARSLVGLPTPEDSDIEMSACGRSDGDRLPKRSLGRDFRSIRSPKEADAFFVRGRVFDVLWNENSSPFSSVELKPSRVSYENVSVSSYGELVYSHIRRFVVAKARWGHCVALPIYIPDGNSSNERNKSEARRRHAIIYDSRYPSQRMPRQSSLTKESISVQVQAGERLNSRSRLNFDKPQSIDWDTKVKNIGMVKGERNLRILRRFFQTELHSSEEGGSITEDKDEQEANSDHKQFPSITKGEVNPRPSIP